MGQLPSPEWGDGARVVPPGELNDRIRETISRTYRNDDGDIVAIVGICGNSLPDGDMIIQFRQQDGRVWQAYVPVANRW